MRRWLFTLSYPVEIHGTIVRYGLLLFCQGKKVTFPMKKSIIFFYFFNSDFGLRFAWDTFSVRSIPFGLLSISTIDLQCM